jgi:hypothetical protein
MARISAVTGPFCVYSVLLTCLLAESFYSAFIAFWMALALWSVVGVGGESVLICKYVSKISSVGIRPLGLVVLLTALTAICSMALFLYMLGSLSINISNVCWSGLWYCLILPIAWCTSVGTCLYVIPISFAFNWNSVDVKLVPVL